MSTARKKPDAGKIIVIMPGKNPAEDNGAPFDLFSYLENELNNNRIKASLREITITPEIKAILAGTSKVAQPVHYLLVMHGDIEPEIKGPFESAQARDLEAGLFRLANGDDHGVFMMEVRGDKVSVDPYSGGQMARLVKMAAGKKSRGRSPSR